MINTVDDIIASAAEIVEKSWVGNKKPSHCAGWEGQTTEGRLGGGRRLAKIDKWFQSPWTAFHLPSFSRRWESKGAMKTKNGPPLFSEGDEDCGSGDNVGKWVKKALLSVILA